MAVYRTTTDCATTVLYTSLRLELPRLSWLQCGLTRSSGGVGRAASIQHHLLSLTVLVTTLVTTSSLT